MELGEIMPERNLVGNASGNSQLVLRIVFKRARILVACCLALSVLVSMQLGCSKLRQSTFNRDVAGKFDLPTWQTDPSDSASRYVTDPYKGLPAEKPKDEARIVAVSSDPDRAEPQIKLVANTESIPPAPSMPVLKANTDLADCDCHEPKMEPKLPFAEPIDPPPIAAKVPPSALVSQPLAPILFDQKTRSKETIRLASSNLNVLRAMDKSKIEKDAVVINRPELIEQSYPDYAGNEILPNPVRVDISQDERVSETIRNRSYTLSTNLNQNACLLYTSDAADE